MQTTYNSLTNQKYYGLLNQLELACLADIEKKYSMMGSDQDNYKGWDIKGTSKVNNLNKL